MSLHLWIVIALAMLAAGGVVHVFLSPYLSGEIKAEKRQAAFRSPGPKRIAENQTDAASRRKQIAESLKDIETAENARGNRLRRGSPNLGYRGAATNISPLRSPQR
jgi:tight adherence protein B